VLPCPVSYSNKRRAKEKFQKVASGAALSPLLFAIRTCYDMTDKRNQKTIARRNEWKGRELANLKAELAKRIAIFTPLYSFSKILIYENSVCWNYSSVEHSFPWKPGDPYS
jgi:hypothetical protein